MLTRSIILPILFILPTITATATPRENLNSSLYSRIVFENYRVHEVPTQDGVLLNMLELLGDNRTPMRHSEPVLLVHGYTSNWNSWYKIGERLRDLGYRVFMANWRGHGQGYYRSLPAPLKYRPLVYDDLPAYDVPAAVNAVYRLSGEKKVIYVGHSMGGMQMHLALAGVSRNSREQLVISEDHAKHIASELKAFIAVGSPVHFVKSRNPNMLERSIQIYTESYGIRLDKSAYIHLRENPVISAAINHLRDQEFAEKVTTNKEPGLLNMRNISRQEFDIIKDYMGSDVPSEFVRSLAQNTKDGYWSADGRIDYALCSMGEPGNKTYYARIPTLLISAEHDVLAPLDAQITAAKNRKMSQFTMYGAGHVDMIMGNYADMLVEELTKFINPL